MKLFFIDVERTFSAFETAKSDNGRSITFPYSFSPRIKSKNVEWYKLNYDTYDFEKHFDAIPDDINTVIWSDRAALFYFGYQTTIWTTWEYERNSWLYDFTKRFPNKRNINLLMEPSEGCGEAYNFHDTLPQFGDKFDLILTHNKQLCKNNKKAKWYPWGTSLLDTEEEFNIYPKSKLVSVNYSDKKWWSGHLFRYNLFTKLKENPDFSFVDITGPLKYKDYIPKIETLKDYYFSIQVENQKVDDFFSDKIIDCFLTGTIPIYKGTDNIGNYFDKDGIITFDTEEELYYILKNLKSDFYHSKIKAINNNFNEAKKYVSPDDWILNQYGNEVFL